MNYIFMEARERRIFKVTLVGSVVNALLVVIKFVAGIMGRSSALVADAVHSLTDFVSDIVVLVFVRLSGKPRDKDHRYGHGKFETLATMIIGVLLLAAGVMLFVNGLKQVIDSLEGAEIPEPSWVALVVAGVSVLVKEILFRYTVKEGKTLNSDAVIANAWHHRSDAISSLGTVVGIGGAILLGEKWRILDPIAAMIVSVLIVKAGYDIIKPSADELLESSLPQERVDEIIETIESVPGVKGYHNLRTRKIGNAMVIDVHLKMDGDQKLKEAHDIATRVEKAIGDRFGENSFINIHMEPK